jgi:hypothetical protein
MLAAAGLTFVLLAGGGVLLQQHNRDQQEALLHAAPKTVELKLPEKKEEGGQAESSSQATAFHLQPSPDELLQQLTSLENLNEDVIAAKFSGLRVLWPVYFFNIEETEGGKATILLDVSEDGFGMVIESEVDTSAYPQLRGLPIGKKIWIGGEILAVDQSGTGTVYLRTEHLTFSDAAPVAAGSRLSSK